MEYLTRPLYNGHLALHCPSCDGNEWQVSLGSAASEALCCPACKTRAPVLDWVSFIKRTGDDDKHIALVIVRKQRNTGYYVQVSTDGRSNENTESVRFCTMAGGGWSLAVLNEAAHIVESLRINDRRECTFEGEGGRLKIYRHRGDADMWMKTSNVEKNVFHGATVFFSKDHVAAPHILDLIQAILTDMKARPL